MELGLGYKKLGRGVLLPGAINPAPETRGKTEIKIYLPFVPVSFQF